MEKYDIIIGMGRCIIEALATKRLAIVTSPEELKFLITDSNLYDAIEANFASNDLKQQTLENIIEQLKKLNSENIKNINILSTPPPLRGTSPQSREGFNS